MENKNKLGIGYITCNAPDRVDRTFQHIPKDLGEVVVVNSGCVLTDERFKGADKVIQTGRVTNVSVSKNRAMRYLMEQGCDHIFLIEDDVIVKDPNVFREYIHGAENSGIWMMNFALQGYLNKVRDVGITEHSNEADVARSCDLAPAPRAKLRFGDKKIAFYHNVIAPFTYMYRGIIENVGYFDERYTNGFEIDDYMIRVIEKGLHPPFGWFADLDNSSEYLDNLEDCMVNSYLRTNEDYGANMLESKQWFKHKHGVSPELISDTPEDAAIKKINKIKHNYARKVLI